MCKKINVLILFLLLSCSHQDIKNPTSAKTDHVIIQEFSRSEVILASHLLTRIFDGEMAPLACVPDRDEASLLLRTIRPRMEVVQDDLEAMLDNQKDIDDLIKECDQNCTCYFIDDLFREHQLVLSKDQKKSLTQKKIKKELNRCLSFAQNTFCQGELYKTLDHEKSDFSFEE